MQKQSGGFIYVAITVLVFLNIFIYTNIITNKIPEAIYPATSESTLVQESEENKTPEYPARYIKADVIDTKAGFLTLVNSTHAFDFNTENARTYIGENVCVYNNKSSNYYTRDMSVYLNATLMEALNKMLDDFSAHLGGKKNVLINQGLRSYDDQQSILNLKIEQLGEDQTIAQKPGFSEHHSGLAMDISTYENGVMGTFTGEGNYAWIHENAHKYGFILRYPEGKEDKTKISYESWHFRYVGVPHAEYMYTNGITLEEYIELLSLYPYESVRLSLTDSVSGESYYAYSVKVPVDGTDIPVPVEEDAVYTLSGDNCGNIIVTVKNNTVENIVPTEETSGEELPEENIED